MLLYLASDLMWATRIKAMADDLKLPARPVRTIEMLDARLADCDVRGLIVDLEAPDVGLAMIERLRSPAASESQRALPIICFAPHVKTEVMAAAKSAGATQVMPRGAFDANLAKILQSMSVG